jgi:predicted O-linked N-acetylglucosamine transferase (SPINDLY family)
MTAGFYQALGNSECIVNSPDQYAAQAVAIASNPSYRDALKESLLASKPHLFENKQAVDEMARFFLEAHHGTLTPSSEPKGGRLW